MANTLTIPVTFTDGTDALAADVNSDFNAVATFLNSTKLNDDNLKAGGVGNPSLASNSVQTAQIVDANVTTAKIADAAITQQKLSTRTTVKTDGTDPGLGGVTISASSGYFSTTTTGETSVLSVSLTTAGRPVRLALIADPADFNFFVGSANIAHIRWYRDSTMLSDFVPNDSNYRNVSEFSHTDVPGAGAHTFSVRVVTGAGQLVHLQMAKLIAYEIN